MPRVVTHDDCFVDFCIGCMPTFDVAEDEFGQPPGLVSCDYFEYAAEHPKYSGYLPGEESRCHVCDAILTDAEN